MRRVLISVVLLAISTTIAWAEEGAERVPAGQDQDGGKARGAESQREPVVMARVGGSPILVEEFMSFLAANPQHLRKARTTEGRAELLRNAIENELLILALREEGLLGEDQSPTSEAVPLALRELAAKHFPPTPAPGEEVLRRYYEAHKQRFGIPPSARVSQIQFAVASSATPEERRAARARAEAALQRIEAGESFGAVAAETTDRQWAAEREGDIGYLQRGISPWFDNAIEGVEVGEHTGIIESPVGYEILLVTDLQDAVTTPFADARDAVAAAWQAEQQSGARAAYVKGLAKRYGVTVEMDELRDAFPEGVFP